MYLPEVLQCMATITLRLQRKRDEGRAKDPDGEKVGCTHTGVKDQNESYYTKAIRARVNVDNSSASFFRCSLKIAEITLAFGVIVNKNVCKTFVGTKIHENMKKICIKYVDAVLREDLAPLTEHNMLTLSQESSGAPH